MTREYKHPNINHTFIIKDINMFEIEIDGIRIKRSDCQWMVHQANYGLLTNKPTNVTIHDLSESILIHVLSLKENANKIK